MILARPSTDDNKICGSATRRAARFLTPHLRMRSLVAATLICAGAAGGSPSWAATIVAPVTAVASSQFISSSNNDYAIENTIDQSGLALSYTSGQTNLESYLASNPMHTSNANGNEWFSKDTSSPNLSPQNAGQNPRGVKPSKKPGTGKATMSLSSSVNQKVNDFGSTSGKRSAGKASKKSNKLPKASTSSVSASSSAVTGVPLVSIIYGFSGPIAINGFVLWNEEFAGIGTTQLLSSIDGVTYTLLDTITPKPSQIALPGGAVVPYLAQVFSFDLTTMLFFKLLIYDCPGPPAKISSYRGCGIGEVAFSSAPRGPSDSPIVPVPAAFPLLASALGIFAWIGRRRAHT